MKTAEEIAKISKEVKILNVQLETERLERELVKFKEARDKQYTILYKWIEERIEQEAKLGKDCCVFWTEGDKVYTSAMKILLDELKDKGYTLKFYKTTMSEKAPVKEEVEVSW